jgi:hypothetical protein
MQTSPATRASQEVIVAAALRAGDLILTVERPGRHHSVFHAADAAGLPHGYYDQGFLTSTGRFVEREEARKIAEAANQLIACQGQDGVPFVRQHRDLFSEDVW